MSLFLPLSLSFAHTLALFEINQRWSLRPLLMDLLFMRALCTKLNLVHKLHLESEGGGINRMAGATARVSFSSLEMQDVEWLTLSANVSPD